ncbi:MAG: hypothetical protein M3O91_01385 [Chloroflexota bacterium]|nr:hypothetical protein [Chloroflexota bacterium]
MSEYDLVCDGCGQGVQPADAVVSWTASGESDSGFALTHPACVPAAATDRMEVRRLVGPNEYLAFVTARFGRVIAEPAPLRDIVWALAPFVLRPDNGAEMDILRAASFGARPGVKPGTEGAAASVAARPAARDTESGK